MRKEATFPSVCRYNTDMEQFCRSGSESARGGRKTRHSRLSFFGLLSCHEATALILFFHRLSYIVDIVAMVYAGHEIVEHLVRQAKTGDREAFSRLMRLLMKDVLLSCPRNLFTIKSGKLNRGMGILPMIHGQDARATTKEYMNIYPGHDTSFDISNDTGSEDRP